MATDMNRYFWIAIFITVLIACDSQSKNTETTEGSHDLFNQLAVVETGLDFPRSMDKLENCRRIQDDPCLRTYDSFSKARANLLRMHTNEALKLTLKHLGEFCIKEPPDHVKYICTGTLVALNYFTEDQEDKEIRQFLSQLPKGIQENVLAQSVAMTVSWLASRTDNKVWLFWFESENVDNMVKANATRRLNSSEQISRPVYEVILDR